MDSDDEDSDSETEVFNQLKDLLVHLNPMIHLAGSSENTFEMLLYLAEMDPTFHKLEIVKANRKGLRESMTHQIENMITAYLESSKGKISGANPVELLTKESMKSKEFLAFKSDMIKNLNEGIATMSLDVKNSSFTEVLSEGEYSMHSHISPANSNETSLNSSLNQSGFLFLHPSQYLSIAEGLQRKQNLEIVNESLDMLLIVTPGEPVSQEAWPSIQKSLKNFLQEDNNKLFYKSLRCHVRLLTSQIHLAVKEGYLNILDALIGFWMSKKLVKQVPSGNEHPFRVSNYKIFEIFKVLIEFIKEFSMLWIRYPSNYAQEMMEATLRVFSMSLSQKDLECMPLLDLVAILDPKAKWFCSWCHSQWGRKKIVNILKNQTTIISYSVSYCLNYLDNNCDIPREFPVKALQPSHLKFLKFIHYMSFSLILATFAESREFFPILEASKEDHITLKRFFLTMSRSVRPSNNKMLIRVILHKLSQFCKLRETESKILCDLGIIDFMTNIISEKLNLNELFVFKFWYCKSLLLFFSSLSTTAIGQEYLLTGKIQKGALTIYLTSNIQTPAQVIFAFAKYLAFTNPVPIEVKQIAMKLCCNLLCTPLGRHFFLSHSLIADIIQVPNNEYLKNVEIYETLKVLMDSQKGVIILEKNSALNSVLTTMFPDLASKGEITTKLLNSVLCSEEACAVVGHHHLLKPFWEMIRLLSCNEQFTRPPLLEEEIVENTQDALLPILCIASTYNGIKLLFSNSGLQEELKECLFEDSYKDSNLYAAALKILGFVAASLDGLVVLQSLYNIQETLCNDQKCQMVKNSSQVIIGENSVMRSHILSMSYYTRNSKFSFSGPLILDAEPSSKTQIIHGLPVSQDDSHKSSRVSHKRQNELWKFLSDTKNGPHDSAWLAHCRRVYRNELLHGVETKVTTLFELIDLALDVLLTSRDEALKGAPHFAGSSNEEFVFPLCSSFNNCIFGYPPNGDNQKEEPAADADKNHPSSVHQPQQYNLPGLPLKICRSSSYMFAAELIVRYGRELNLISEAEIHVPNVLKLISAVDMHLISHPLDRIDWFSILCYILSGGNIDKAFSTLRKLRGLKIGCILWPSLSSALSESHLVLSNEIHFGSIIHSVKLVLFRDSPSVYLGLEEIGDGIIWNILSEWLMVSFIGVLPWPENIHIFLLPLINGMDYLIYCLVSLLVHLQSILVEQTFQSNVKKILLLQTEPLSTWRIQDYINYMDSLSRRFHRVVMSTLTQPLINLKQK